MLHCFHLHLVCKGALTGQDVFSLEIRVHHQYGGGIVRHITDNDRHCFQTCKLCSVLAAMAGNDFITSFRAWAGDERRQHTVLRDAFDSVLHFFVILHPKWMVFEWKQLCNRNLLYLLPLLCMSGFFGRKNLIDSFQRYV